MTRINDRLEVPASAPNDSRRPDPAKDLAEELAALLASASGARTLRLLQMAGFLGAADQDPLSASVPVRHGPAVEEGAPRAIGIWQPVPSSPSEGHGLRFVRPPVSPLGDHYAATRTIEAGKPSGRRRVVWLGESAAAGYLYAPHVTPAALLGQQLGAGFEVVDLARTNERLATLVSTADRARQLTPDAFVVFAGNNWTLLETPEWSPFASGVRSRQRLAKALRRNGLRGAVQAAQRTLERRVDEAIASLTAVAQRAGASLVWVVPEVNVRDWDAHQPVHRLPGDGVARWYRARDEARVALREACWRDALKAADVMVGLDEGLGPTGHRLRARALEGLARRPQARAAWRAAVDATSMPGQGYLAAPQAPSWVQTRLREAAQHAGHGVVDLPALMAQRMGWNVADRRLFLDYCHLNLEGMTLVARAVANEVAERLGESVEPGPAVAVAPAVEATARFGAALHTAHRLAPVERSRFRALLASWCRGAVEASPTDAGRAIRAVVSARTGGLPAVLDAAQQAMIDSAVPLQTQHGWTWPHLDADLLTSFEPFDDVGPLDGARMVAHLGVGRRGVELTQAPYLWSPVERLLPDALDADGPAFYRAASPRSRFAVVTDGLDDIALTMVARCPWLDETATAIVSIGVMGSATEVTSVAVGAGWTRHEIRVPKACLPRGSTCLIVSWPMPDFGDEPLVQVAETLESGHEMPLHPVFGEIFSLRARCGDSEN